MNANETPDSLDSLDTQLWQGVAGQYVTQWETQLLSKWVGDVFGYYAIQLGHHGRITCLQDNRCSERYAIEQGQGSSNPSAADAHDIRHLDVPDFAVLPFASDSIDLVVLPHTLDEHPDPHGVLREAYRVLRAEGRMVILGFNPLSIWGAQAKYCSWRTSGKNPFGFYPSLPHPPIQIGRLKDWIELLNCDVVRGAYGCYTPFVHTEHWQKRWHWMEDAGDRWWGFAGAVYALKVVKRVYSPTMIGLINEKKSGKKWVTQVATSTIHQHKNTHTPINSDK